RAGRWAQSQCLLQPDRPGPAVSGAGIRLSHHLDGHTEGSAAGSRGDRVRDTLAGARRVGREGREGREGRREGRWEMSNETTQHTPANVRERVDMRNGPPYP